jgi:predicted RNase H-like nuclease
VGGLDGCRGGWVLATVPARGSLSAPGSTEVMVVGNLGGALATFGNGLAAVAVDIPIGLAACGPRACDVEARHRLGPRRNSVFPAPARGVLATTTYEEACAVSRQLSGKGLSKQLYNILARIREVDDLLSPSPCRQQRLFEACPELSFALMAGGVPMRHSKRTAEGRGERLSALRASGFMDLTTTTAAPPAGAARDDVLDALALAWTARRQVAGDAIRFGDETDDRGLRMEITA